MGIEYTGNGGPDGTIIQGEKLGFYNLATPIAQRTGSSMTALTLTTATSANFGFVSSAAFNAFTAQHEEMRATLVALGLHAGA